MKSSSLYFISILLVSQLFCAPAGAFQQVSPSVGRTYPVDDSASVVYNPNVNMRWESPVPRPGSPDIVSGDLVVNAILDVRPYLGRRGNIYMTLPVQSFGRVSTSWKSRKSILSPGTLRDGERTLVWSGLVSADRIEDTLVLSITTDGNQLWRTEQLHYSFEIEITQ